MMRGTRRSFPELPKWTFELRETSPHVWMVTGRHASGPEVSRQGLDEEALFDECRSEAQRIDRELTSGISSRGVASPMPTDATFATSDGLRLFERAWVAEAARGVVAIVHGYAEHSGRYQHVAEHLVGRGYSVYAFDLRGHGRSEGARVFVRSFNEYLDDVEAFLDRVRGRAGGKPVFLLGHSMGGAIVALAAVTRRPQVRALVFSGPALKSTRRTPGIALKLMMALGRLAPRLRLMKLAAADVSRDPAVVAAYDADPLVYRGRMPLGLMASAVRAGRAIDNRVERIDQALLAMHGSEDQLASPEGSRTLVERASSTDKTLRIYDGLYHEIFNEPEQAQVLDELVDWLDARCRRDA
jgi:alpha-beta hydrolase superfamily lysophospholipase